MTTGQRIYECRKQSGMTQGELADRLGVTRQAVSKWESDAAFPETEKLVELCKLFNLSADELLLGKEPQESAQEEKPDEQIVRPRSSPRYEYISKVKICGIPLVHVHFGLGVCRAKGILAIGNIATGVIAIGPIAAGVASLGAVSVGILTLGAIILGLFSFGGIAVGLFAFGGVAVGVYAFGGVAAGYVAIGGAAFGKFALGDWAHGWFAAGLSHASGAHAFLIPEAMQELSVWLSENVSKGLGSFIEMIANLLN